MQEPKEAVGPSPRGKRRVGGGVEFQSPMSLHLETHPYGANLKASRGEGSSESHSPVLLMSLSTAPEKGMGWGAETHLFFI